jgi:DUF1009 family protein
MAKIAILAGGMSLPQQIAQHCDAQKKDYLVIGIKNFADPEWVSQHPHEWVGLAQVGKLYRFLQLYQCNKIVFAGAVKRPRWWQIFPDWQGIKLLWRLKKWPKGDDTLLRLLAHEFEMRGIELIGADEILVTCLIQSGNLTHIAPDQAQLDLIQKALPTLKDWAYKDNGQAIVVDTSGKFYPEQRDGTDALIESCANSKGAILIKIKKPQQDRRLDLPTIGLETVRHAITSGFSGIAAEAGNVLFLQSDEAITLANKHSFFIVGIELND